ncbi:Rossmann-like domain-containing protein [Saliterribacillus persicus]|uniref:Putative heavy-metal chelation protein n=1 Tax=Saliterribacillus persicus TaxID=930114 RepID=A0A368YCE6_9BACI|nr:DUF364 domain-containing protein [Saliterribacillus persicus]RCW77016.1 putative heavy-metal chelation protein [Saliterribacillus persicus]
MADVYAHRTVSDLRDAILDGVYGADPAEMVVTGSAYIYQTTQFPSSTTKYGNYYLLLRIDDYFGACSHMPDQLSLELTSQYAGASVADLLLKGNLPLQIAIMDAYLGTIFKHKDSCTRELNILGGDPIQKAKERDHLIAEVSPFKPSEKVALIGVVNPLVDAITNRGGICLPCDLQLDETETGIKVEKDMENVLDLADAVICTAMTLSNGTFDRILQRTREKKIPLTFYAQTGSAIVAQWFNQGVTSLIAEPFPFTQFNADATKLYVYENRKGP